MSSLDQNLVRRNSKAKKTLNSSFLLSWTWGFSLKIEMHLVLIFVFNAIIICILGSFDQISSYWIDLNMIRGICRLKPAILHP